MRKDKLIDLLLELQGNPEIYLWNGLVGDIMDIQGTLGDVDLVKDTYKMYEFREVFNLKRDNNSFDYEPTPEELLEIKKDYRKYAKYEMNQFVTQAQIDAKDYTMKTVKILQAKTKGATYYDRLGSVKY